MVLLKPDAFLTQLTRSLEKSRSKGTIYVTFKRIVPGVKASAASASEGTPEHRCLVRAVSGKTKFSAELTDRNYQKFMQSYGNILKVSLDSLKKREKKKSDISRGQSTRLIVKKASDKKATR